MKKLAIIAAILVGSLSFATAQTQTPGINHRQAEQQKRIHQGERSGELTHREAKHLEHRERRIQHEKRMDKNNGYVTRAERRKLNRDLNHENRAIYRDKHNHRKG